jgi:hypothetical protein
MSVIGGPWGLIRDIDNGKDWDIRDHVQLVSAPASGSCRINYMKDQRQHGACTGFGIERVVRMALKTAGLPDIDLSPLFAYYNNRIESGLSPTLDTGATIRGSIDAARKFGLCQEAYWTYKHADGYLHVKPEGYAYEDALQHQVLEAYAVPNSPDMIRAALASGFGVTYGTTVHYNAYQNAPNGDVQMPQANDWVPGAHNTVIDSWDDARARYGFGNSWGMWGAQGFGTVPYEHVSRYGFDLWAVRVVESPNPKPAPVQYDAVVTKRSGAPTTVFDAARIEVNGTEVWRAP